MTRDELISYARVLLNDTVDPYLISTETLDAYATEAEREASERALYFRTDSTYDIAVSANVASYELDELIISIERLKISGEARPLTKTTRRELDFELSSWESDTETPTMYFQQGRIITLYPKPSASKTLLVDAYRRSEYDMETPIEHHESLAYWMLYRVFSRPDYPLFDLKIALMNRDLFQGAFGRRRSERANRAWNNGSPSSSMYVTEFSG